MSLPSDGQKQIKALEFQRNENCRSLFEAQNKVDLQRQDLIVNIESKHTHTKGVNTLFTLRWRLQ
jgi:hypothetical protein